MLAPDFGLGAFCFPQKYYGHFNTNGYNHRRLYTQSYFLKTKKPRSKTPGLFYFFMKPFIITDVYINKIQESRDTMLGSITLPIIKGVPGIKGGKVTILKTNEPGVLRFQAGLSLGKKYTVEGIEWEHKEGRNIGKAAVGTIAGGLLTGGIGAIAGAAIGGRKRDQSTAIIKLEVGDLYVKAAAKEIETLKDWLI